MLSFSKEAKKKSIGIRECFGSLKNKEKKLKKKTDVGIGIRTSL